MKPLFWYAIKVVAGKEEKVKGRLEKHDIVAVIPQKRVFEYKAGKWKERIIKLIPGYVFVKIPKDDYWLYYLIKNTWFVLYFLGSGLKQPIADEEMEYILLINDFKEKSIVEYNEQGKLKFIGPIEKYRNKIVKLDRRKKKVLLEFDLSGEKKRTWVGVEFQKALM
jgi:transcription antitermination factor NusG